MLQRQVIVILRKVTDNTVMSVEERAAHLETLKARLKGKKEQEARQAAELAKSNELLRRKAGKDLSEYKEKLEEKQVNKAVEEQKRAKLEEKAAKTRILAQIEEDRRAKREIVMSWLEGVPWGRL